VSKTWKALKQARLSSEAQTRVQARVARAVEARSLKALRQELALTQAQVSAAADMTQSELSRLEAREDHLTSTLRRYVEALGGELEVSAVFGKRRVKLTDA
jgi:predicted transcriptional regulator